MRDHLPTPTPFPPPPAEMASLVGMGNFRGRGMKPKEGGGGFAAPSLLENLLPPLHPSFPRREGRCTGGEGGRGVRLEPNGSGGPGEQAARALVIGLGNPLRGDDGLGPAVIAALQPAAVGGLTLIESDGHDLVEWLASEEFDRIVVVDAADLGRTPGSWTRLTPERLAASKGRLTHGMGLRESLELLAALGLRRAAPISIYAVQPAAVGWEPGLSREVGQAIRPVADAIWQELYPPKLPASFKLAGSSTAGEGQCSGQTRKSVACPAAARRHN